MPKTMENIGDLAVCKKVALKSMLYSVISLINRSPALPSNGFNLDPMDLTLTPKDIGS